MNDSHSGTTSMERLSADECWRLLSRAEVGRLGLVVLDVVEIFPVNFAVEDRRIVFRTAPGQKMLGLLLKGAVAFEIDGWDDRVAWSVLVKGTPKLMPDSSETPKTERAGLEPWAPGRKDTYVLIEPDEVTGRRFERTPKAETVWYW